MFLLFGTRAVAALLFVVTFVCGHCGVAAPQQIVRERQKVTLFFIPLFSLGTSYLIECSNCGMVTGLSRQQAEHSMQWADAHGIAVSP
ncbi:MULTISPECIES: zinc-ribbon domain-containing protein [unclassified Curtobacterium]|uniref:zinc-ribbon domain-containing protein n=1 Tax=unclassified Curtobacterium TaxID=257496 RepID=UPI000D8E8333|nr:MULTISPECIES: zinc-ribbon domain-containing protein [unclassified Curtobacterium]PYY39648.1 zinc-ribbon domain-containing protein [Curtobacterium sp. MCPF17_046]PYY51911.1 zinc-ribbon domain-containing protein [Curtobacterium sp. MCBD17_023]WIB15647.1 zinc-ribbon domain-containing protein [Curtobacterium sp. MCPF17_050]